MIKRRVMCYTDGSCPRNPGPGGWAFAIVLEEDHGRENILDSGYELDATNNTMELTAGIRVLERLEKEKMNDLPVFVHSDSRYVVDGMQQYRHAWAESNFKYTNVNSPLKNGGLWRHANETANKFKRLRFMWLRGHVGHYWNEQCDAMAGRAVKIGNREQNRKGSRT